MPERRQQGGMCRSGMAALVVLENCALLYSACCRCLQVARFRYPAFSYAQCDNTTIMSTPAGSVGRESFRIRRHVPISIFVVAMTVRIALVLLLHTYREQERNEVTNTAISLATGHGFANAFGPNTGPTAHVSPLYPLILSVTYRLVGTGQEGALVQQVI